MDDSEALQLAQMFELMKLAKSSVELEGVNWIYVYPDFIRNIFYASGPRRDGRKICLRKTLRSLTVTRTSTKSSGALKRKRERNPGRK